MLRCGQSSQLRLRVWPCHGFFHVAFSSNSGWQEARQTAVNLRVDYAGQDVGRIGWRCQPECFWPHAVPKWKLLIEHFCLHFPQPIVTHTHTHTHTHAFKKRKNFDKCRITECFGDENSQLTGPDCFWDNSLRLTVRATIQSVLMINQAFLPLTVQNKSSRWVFITLI